MAKVIDVPFGHPDRREALYRALDGLTPGQACEELNVEVDELFLLIHDSDIEFDTETDDVFPRLRWGDVKALKADPERLARYRMAEDPVRGSH